MSVSEDLINFDIIETQKENIQPLSSGRSAKTLATTFAPSLLTSNPGNTKTLNDALRAEYEAELAALEDSDDPLDIYDRYVKWTFAAYPSAQATVESQLRPLLERATKAFRSVGHYKNDPRYLRVWLHYIRFFSDAPRETFAYLSKHGIGEGLALFYEEFATWLETAKRWNQADEVYKLGIEREARPMERLARKYGEFQQRFQGRTLDAEEPTSPALPIVRPALAAKVDPFDSSAPRSSHVPMLRASNVNAASTNRGARSKLAVFSDKDEPTNEQKCISAERSNGWDNIGNIVDRKKENAIEARPWTGERLPNAKRATTAPKMAIFKDESKSHDVLHNKEPESKTCASEHGKNTRSGRAEHVFVCLNAIYPNKTDSLQEMSIEELRAESRGWIQMRWSQHEYPDPPSCSSSSVVSPTQGDVQHLDSSHENEPQDVVDSNIIEDQDSRNVRPKKTRLREVRTETQTIRANLESPTGPRLRRKNSSEPTMTLHTKAATDDILDIFNQPLRNVDPMGGHVDSDRDSECDDDDFTSAGESTGTGRISTSDFEDTEPNDKTRATDVANVEDSVSPWSDFSSCKHVPKIDDDNTQDDDSALCDGQLIAVDYCLESQQEPPSETEAERRPNYTQETQSTAPRFIPIPPEDYEPPAKYQRNPTTAALNRLPFMTPILEKTETSATVFAAVPKNVDSCPRTPSRHPTGVFGTPAIDGEPLSSPLQEIVNESRLSSSSLRKATKAEAALHTDSRANLPIVNDTQCNPIDDAIRRCILARREPSLPDTRDYHDCSHVKFNKAPEIRKFIRSLAKTKSSERTNTSLSVQPTLIFPRASAFQYTIRRELGKGAFAPVYLAEEMPTVGEESDARLVAIKSEDPPSSWEYHIMNLLHTRLASESRMTGSLLRAQGLHLFGDEGYLIEEYLDQGTLLDLVNSARADPTSGQSTLDESVVMFFTIELLRVVEAMHRVGILHGDLKADNCLIRLRETGLSDSDWSFQYQADGSYGWDLKGLKLIDFGRSIDMTPFRSDVQFIADWKTGKQDCVEMRELRPWTYQVDYFGLAGVVHSLLFGKYIETVAVDAKDGDTRQDEFAGRKRYRIREGLKRYWQTELWSRLFDLTLNPLGHVDGGNARKLPCTPGLERIRRDMETWLTEEGSRRNGGLKSNLTRIETRLREKKAR